MIGYAPSSGAKALIEIRHSNLSAPFAYEQVENRTRQAQVADCEKSCASFSMSAQEVAAFDSEISILTDLGRRCDHSCSQSGLSTSVGCGAGEPSKYGKSCRVCFNIAAEADEYERTHHDGSEVIMCESGRSRYFSALSMPELSTTTSQEETSDPTDYLSPMDRPFEQMCIFMAASALHHVSVDEIMASLQSARMHMPSATIVLATTVGEIQSQNFAFAEENLGVKLIGFDDFRWALLDADKHCVEEAIFPLSMGKVFTRAALRKDLFDLQGRYSLQWTPGKHTEFAHWRERDRIMKKLGMSGPSFAHGQDSIFPKHTLGALRAFATKQQVPRTDAGNLNWTGLLGTSVSAEQLVFTYCYHSQDENMVFVNAHDHHRSEILQSPDLAGTLMHIPMIKPRFTCSAMLDESYDIAPLLEAASRSGMHCEQGWLLTDRISGSALLSHRYDPIY